MGGGGLLLDNDIPIKWWAVDWQPQVLNRFKAELGDPAHQTTWEMLTQFMCAVLWAPAHGTEALVIKGDNIGALQNALRLKGRGMLAAIARELSWRKAAFGWNLHYEHLPSELNTRADALSRLCVPGESYVLPGELASVPRVDPPTLDDSLFKTWLETLPPRG